MKSLVYLDSLIKINTTFLPQRTPVPPHETVMVFDFSFRRLSREPTLTELGEWIDIEHVDWIWLKCMHNFPP